MAVTAPASESNTLNVTGDMKADAEGKSAPQTRDRAKQRLLCPANTWAGPAPPLDVPICPWADKSLIPTGCQVFRGEFTPIIEDCRWRNLEIAAKGG
jgi:hypothetical protein